MKKTFISTIISFCTILMLSQLCHAEIIDRIVAEVNNEIITLSELNEQGKPFFQAVMQNAPTGNIESELQKVKKEVLSRIIDQIIIKQEADKLELSVLDSDVDAAIDQILKENMLTLSQFRQELKKMGTDEPSYRSTIGNQMLKSRLVNIEIRSKVVITEEKIKEYYDNYYSKQYDAPNGYHIQQIGFLWGDNFKSKTPEQARALAVEVKNLLLDGEDFRSLAQKYSDLPSAEDGGDIGVFAATEMATYMRETIKNMLPGETSDIIATPDGYQIFKLLSANKDGVTQQAPFDSVKTEIKDILYKQEIEREYEKWINDIREKAYIKINL